MQNYNWNFYLQLWLIILVEGFSTWQCLLKYEMSSSWLPLVRRFNNICLCIWKTQFRFQIFITFLFSSSRLHSTIFSVVLFILTSIILNVLTSSHTSTAEQRNYIAELKVKLYAMIDKTPTMADQAWLQRVVMLRCTLHNKTFQTDNSLNLQLVQSSFVEGNYAWVSYPNELSGVEENTATLAELHLFHTRFGILMMARCFDGVRMLTKDRHDNVDFAGHELYRKCGQRPRRCVLRQNWKTM